MTPRRSTIEIWGAPIVIGVLSLVGLVSALLGDGIWDALSWLGLAIPVAVSARSLRDHDSSALSSAFKRNTPEDSASGDGAMRRRGHG